MSPQETIAHYRVISKLGEGGMGAVYRAIDTKLNREVAIKVLRPVFLSDTARMGRFQREAQALAALNHPNIAAIYGIEQDAIVMELVPGEELKGPLPVDTAIAYARQVAAALEAAHEKGIVHRDLKPANIKVTPEGMIKVLDFGLAKASEEIPAASAASPTTSPTLSLAMTQAGVILGTAAYMAPEQARGKPVDKRADVWAFGVVFYEMLTGAMLFGGGETISDSMAAVLTREPDWSLLPKDTPLHVRRLLELCLRKDPKLRLRDIGDARIALDEPNAAAPPEPRVAPASSWRWPVVAAILAVVAAVAGFGWWRDSRAPAAMPIRLQVDLGADALINPTNPALISPDGSRLLYTISRKPGDYLLATRLLSETGSTILPGTEGAVQPFFSADGQWVGFLQGRELKKVGLQGGAVSTIVNGIHSVSCDAGQDGTLVCSETNNGVLDVLPPSGNRRTFDFSSSVAWWPQVLPGNKEALVTLVHGLSNFDYADIAVVSLATGERRNVFHGGYHARYLASGHLLYAAHGTLFAAPFNLRSMSIERAPVAVATDLGNDTLGRAQFEVSRNGTLIYLPGAGSSTKAPLAWMDATGKRTLILPPGDYAAPALSPDGRRLAYTVQSGDAADIWVYDLVRETSTQLTFHAKRLGEEVAWAPDGKHLVYGADLPEGAGLWWARADASGQPQPLLSDSKLTPRPQSISADGRTLVYSTARAFFPDLSTLPLDLSDPEHPKAGTPQPYLTTPGLVEVDGVLSPDGRWMAYACDESGEEEVFVRPFPLGSNGGGKFRISSAGGKFPSWSTARHELYFLGGDDRIMVAGYQIKGLDFEAEKPRPWLSTQIMRTGVIRGFAMSPDGARAIVFPSQEQTKGPARMNFVLNLFDELRRIVPPAR